MPSYIAYIFVALVSIFVTTNWFLPLLARYLTRCRLTYLSLSRIKGFEWRHESHASAIVPDIRLEHGSWRYGGWNRPQGVGLFVIYASGLSYRQRDRPRPRQENKVASQKPPSPLAEYLAPVTGMMGGLAKTLVIGVPSLLLHHYPSLGGLLSFQISDGRVIFDELDGLELTWSVLKLGAKVSFSKKDEAGLEQDGKEAIGRSSISSTAADDIDPSWPASPPDSPVVDRHRPFVFPSASELNVNADAVPRPSRLSHARRRASAMSSRMTSTAAQVWGRVIGRAKGHVKLTIEFNDLAIILPHSNPTHPLSRPSIPDLVPQPHPQCDSNGLSHSLSTKSLKARTIKNTYSMDRLFRSVPRYALPSHEGGYERLLALEGESKITGTMRFGTRRGWLAEDTLSLDTELGKLQTSLGAWTKVQALMDKYKKSKVGPRDSEDEKTKDMGGKKAEDRWSSESKARILLRAFQSISISLSQVVISHFLSVSNSNAGSVNSSTSDLSSLVSEDYFTLSLDVRALAIKLSAADSSNNLRARNAFGTNNNRTSRVKGVGLTLSWDAIDIESISPGAPYADRHQLLAIRQADLEGFSSWRPHGWTRDELLFVTDPNLALVVSRASIGSIDAAADVQLLNELSEAWAATHPRSAPTASPTHEPVKSAVQLHQGLPPRFRLVLDIGHCKFVLADRISQQKTMLIVETHGIHLGGYTNFADRVGRRKDKMSTRNAFKEEEQLQQRRAEYGDSVDYALPDAMLRPQVRRRFNQENAKLLEDLTMSMSFDGNLEMEPLSVHLSLQQGETGQKETFSLAEIGRMHGVASGDVLGRQILDLIDTARLDPSTLSGFVDFGIESGINVNLWEVPVLDALVALGEAHTGTDASPALPPRSKVDILSRLPSGLSCRFSLGLISVFIGQPDPNPAFERKLIRGIWFQTLAVFEYAYYVNTAQTVRTRHDLIAPTRAKLKLKEDITTQALACYHHHAKTDGRSALCRVTLLETFVTPIFDGRKFDEAGGTKMNFKTWQWPEPPMREEDYTAWEFIKPRKSSSIDSAVRQPRPNVEQSKSQPRPQRQSKKKQPENTPLPAEFNDEPTEVIVKGTEGENEIKEKFFAGWNAFLNEFGLASISSLLGFESSPLSPEEVEADVNDGEGKQTRKKLDAADKEKYGSRPDAGKATGTEAPSNPAPTANEAATKKAQELRDAKVDEDKVEDGVFSNAIPVFDEAGTNRARRPIFRMESADINWTIEKTTPDAEVEHRFTGKSKPIAFVCGMPLIYCAILAVLGIKRVAEAWKRPPSETEGSRKRPLIHVDFSIPSTTIHMAFPLHEHMFVYLGAMRIGLKANRQMRLDLDQTLVYVPSTSPREKGQWHEFGLVKNLVVTKDATDPVNPINVDMEAFRIRVPVGYQISNLVLNITASIKGLKLIMENLKSGKFHTKKSPAAEDPKNVPPIVISIKEVSLEAKDSPIEERLNLIWRVGMAEQLVRLDMEETMSRKIEAIEEYEKYVKAGELTAAELLEDGEFSPFHRRDPEVAEGYLNELISEHWLRRIRAAQTEQKRREQVASDRIHLSTRDLKLPISVAPPALSAPLFRASFQDFKLSIKNPGMARDEIIEYMGEVSASPFDKGTEFSLMVPLHLQWDMGSAKVSLRDYPLPLVNIRPCADGRPAWTLDTTFIIAEELHDDDSTMYVPCEIIPAGLGDSDAEPSVVEVYKTISPVKTYTRPHIKIHSERTTEFTWGNSMQPAIQDFMKVMETLSHAQIDPSPRIGFWDKFRLILHWVVKIDFEGPVHLHLKGSNDPYLVDGKGAGFALAWENNTHFRIAVPNEQYETIQITAEQLLIAIPDLAALNDHAALGVEQIIDENHAQTLEHALLDRRYTKPCARFMNGVRVGFGFALERTCRQHSCKNEGCDSTAESLMHRSCRITDFKRHQDVILRNKQAVQRDEARLDRKVDSYDGFRSDYIHFSVSVTCPLREIDPDHPPDSTSHNSLHLSPKAFAHFNSWWNLFNHVMSLPIRQGRLFPDSPEPSKKFGDSLATIKYRCDLKPVYVSHMYGQKSRELWDQGKTQSLGIKARFGHFRADIHQRKEEKQESHKKLKRDKVVSHKAFYAADLILEDIEVKGIRAEFHELPSHLARRSSDDSSIPSDHDPHREGTIEYTRASELGPGDKAWFNLYDFIDADKRPFDHDPKIELVNVADCPEVFYSLRKKVRTAPLQEGQTSELGMSKFGDEKSHICYLGESKSVATVQIKITRRRIRELQDKVKKMQLNPSSPKDEVQVYKQRLQILHDHIKKMESEEKRDIDGNTFELDADLSDQDCRTGETFQNVVHVHCPSIYFTNQSRNLAYQYWYSYRDRKREEYHTSNKSLVTVREDFDKRIRRRVEREKKDSETPSEEVGEADDLLAGLKKALGSRNAPDCFRLPVDNATDHVDLREPSVGLPAECKAQPKFRFLLLKPQVTFRSEADPDAIILLAVEEYSHQTFKVIDTTAKDDVSMTVLHRNYGSLKGLQAFYPNAETLARDRNDSGESRGSRRVPALPLEIFLDVKSEAKDYDRIILKTDAAISQDKFNKLRVQRDLKWPETHDEQGEPIKHLKEHMDLVTLVVPRIALSATSKHYSALYTVITDLLLYQDPDHEERNKLINTFMLQFDRKERDPKSLLGDIENRQREVRYLREIVRGYDQHLDLLTDEGKAELFACRARLFEQTEDLFCVFELLSAGFQTEDAKAAVMNATQTNIRAGSIAWNLLKDDMTSLVKLDIDGTMLSVMKGKDQSLDSACVVSDLSALNNNPDAIFPEVAVRYEPGGLPRGARDPMVSVVWSSGAVVGGIQIVHLLSLDVHPLRLQLEERVGRQIKDYIFNDRVAKRREAAGNATPRNDSSSQKGSSKASSTLELAPLNRSRSAVSVNSNTQSVGGRSVSTSGRTGEFDLVPQGDADEMRRRANNTRTFERLEVSSTTIVVTYKRDDKRRHKTWSMPAAVDLKIKTPRFAYADKIWTIEDAFKQMQRDGISNMLLSTSLIGQVVRKTGVFRSNRSLKSLAKHTSPSARPSGGFLGSPSSRLKFAVESSNEDEQSLSKAPTRDGGLGSPIQRVVSRLSQHGHLSAPSSPSSAERSSSSHLSKSPSTSMMSRSRDRELSEPADSMPSDEAGNSSGEEQHEGGSVGRAVKGLMHKFKHRKDAPEMSSRRGSHDDVNVGRLG